MGFLNKFKKVEDDFVEAEDEVTKKLKRDKLIKIGIGCGIALVVILVMILVKVLGGSKSETNFYDILTGLFTNEQGSFTYNFEVQTSPKGEVPIEFDSETSTTEASTEEASTEYVAEVPVEDTSESKHDLVAWNGSKDAEIFSWDYPSYHISISGCTMSVDPLEMQFEVSIKTQYYNNVFTDVIVKDGNYYINVEAMRNWLTSSKDSYLISVGSKLPNGSKYLKIPAEEFAVPSRYAENSEKDLSKAHSIMTLYRRFVSDYKLALNQVRNSVGEAGLIDSEGKLGINLSGADAVKVLGVVKSIAEKQGDFYSARVENYKSAGLVDESQYAQMMREKDNVITAFHDLAVYMNIADLNAMNPQISGLAQQYQNGSGANVIEVTSLRMTFSGEKRDYFIAFSGRREGSGATITAPDSSTFTRDGMSSPDLIQLTIADMMDYFNVSPVKLSQQLELTPENIVTDAKQRFCDMVNDYGYYNKTLTLENWQEFFDKYTNFRVDKNSTDGDVACTKMATDFINDINSVTGGLVKETIIDTSAEGVDEVEKYPETVYESDGLKVVIRVDEASSSPQFIHAKARIEYSGTETVVVNASDFSVRTLLNSTYPANNEILIRNYDSLWDTSTLVQEMEFAPNTFREFDLYFVIAADDTEASKHLDLFYGDVNMGVAVEY